MLVFPDICNLSTTLIPPSARLFPQDFPTGKLAELPASITAPDESWRTARDRPLPARTFGQRFQDLLSEQDRLVEVIGSGHQDLS